MNPIDNAIVLEEAKRYTNSQRIAYVESQQVILDENLAKNIDFNGSFFSIDDADHNMLEVGKTYTVTTDSGTYKTVCKSPNANVKYIGNIAKTDGGTNGVEDTGEPFGGMLFYEDLGNGNAGWFAIFIDFQYGTHMKIIGEETIHPIDPKFLPGVCLPVVELSVVLADGEEKELSEADVSAIEKITGDLMLCKIAKDEIGIPLPLLMSSISIEGDAVWVTSDTTVMLLKKKSGWVAMRHSQGS